MLGDGKSVLKYSFAEINQPLLSDVLRRLSETREREKEGDCDAVEESAEIVRIVEEYGDDRYSDELFDNIELPTKDETSVVRFVERKVAEPVLYGLHVVGAPDDLADLAEEDQLKVACIKESLHSAEDASAESVDLRFLTCLSPEMVAAVLDELETESILEARLALLVRSFIATNENASLIVGMVFTAHALVPKLDSMNDGNHVVPRVLSEALAEFSKTFPRVAIEGLVVPLVKKKNAGKTTEGVLQAVIRDGIPKEHAASCMRYLIQESQMPAESLLILIHFLVLKKGPLEGSLSQLTQWILLAGAKLKSDMKFAKLLMDLLNFYGDGMLSAQLEDLAGVISTSATLLKRPLESLLKKLMAAYVPLPEH